MDRNIYDGVREVILSEIVQSRFQGSAMAKQLRSSGIHDVREQSFVDDLFDFALIISSNEVEEAVAGDFVTLGMAEASESRAGPWRIVELIWSIMLLR